MTKLTNICWADIWDDILKIGPMIDYDDIKVGDILHIPPMGVYDRETHVIVSKWPNYLITDKVLPGGEFKRLSLFKDEMRMRFAVRIQKRQWEDGN